MGLIKAAVSAIGSTFQDQWKEVIRCDDLGNEVLMRKETTSTGVITNKSTIIVGPGQCAIIYDNGRVIDATAEEGIYHFDTSSSPSFFAGQFGAVFKEMWERFTYDGGTAKEQAVFFFNVKEILENKFGTSTPIPYQDWSHPLPNQMTGEMLPLRVNVKCFGRYTFIIENPSLFMSKVSGLRTIYRKDDLIEQIRSEVIAAFQNILNELGNAEHKIPVLELPSQTDEIKKIMDEKVFDEAIRKRGIRLESFAVESVTLDDESVKKIDEYEFSSNAYVQQAKMVESYSEAVKDAASNPNGTLDGFIGVGMMNIATDGLVNAAKNSPWDDKNKENVKQIISKSNEDETNETWICPKCNASRSGKFCRECGTQKPESSKKIFCSNCGREVNSDAKFCSECGNKLD